MPETDSRPADRLRLARLARGYSQGELAKATGVTRQAISGIESGRWSPSLDVALALARAFDSSVEALFGETEEAPAVVARMATRTPSTAKATRLLLSEVNGETIAFPLSCDGSFVPGFLPALGVTAGPTDVPAAGSKRPRGGARRERAGSLNALRIAEAGLVVSVAGCDPALALLQGPLARRRPQVGLVWWPCGNEAALEMARSGSVHVAAVHRSASTPSRPGPSVKAVGFAAWREGLAFSPRYRGEVGDLADVVAAGLRIANREPGSEARRLLDERLEALGIRPEDVVGYDTECTAHLLVASAVSSGLADATVTTEPAALAFGLEFVAWQEEISELHIARSVLGSPEVRALIDILGGHELPRQLATVQGYDAEPCGKVLVA